MRLKSAFRLALYGIFALLFVSGAVWLLADQMKNNPDGRHRDVAAGSQPTCSPCMAVLPWSP